MSSRRLVVVEQDPADAQYGALFGLDASQASGVPIPAFQSGPALPAVGTVEGQGFIVTTSRQGFVWANSRWVPIAPSPVITYPTEAQLLADGAQPPGSYGAAGDTGNMFIMTPTGWRMVGIRTYANQAALQADNPGDGAMGLTLDDDTLYVRAGGVWRAETTRVLPDLAAVKAWTPALGAEATETADGLSFIRGAAGWLPKSTWQVPLEATLLARTDMLSGQIAVAMDTGHRFLWNGTAWVGEPIRHYPTEAELLADATAAEGVLAWGDDTGLVFARSNGIWKRLTDSLTIAVNATGIGSIAAYSVLTVPDSHLVCDGSTFDKVKFPELFAFLGSDKVPDLRDKFLRGWSATRAPMDAQGQSTARPSTAFTTDRQGSHRHIEGQPGYKPYGSAFGFSSDTSSTGLGAGGTDNRAYPYTSTEGEHAHTVTGGGDVETRPANIAIVYAIQATALQAVAIIKPAPPVVGWTQTMWPKDSVVVNKGSLWRAVADVPSTEGEPAPPSWEAVFGSQPVTIGPEPATKAGGDIWLDPSPHTSTRGLNLWDGSEWVSFSGGNLQQLGANLPAPGYIDKRPLDTEKPNKVGGLALSTSTSGEIISLAANTGHGYKYLTPPSGDYSNKRRIVMCNDAGEPVWVDGCYRIAAFDLKGSANHLLVENMHLYRKVEVDFVMIPRGGDVEFKVKMDDASGTEVTWNGATIGNYGSGSSKQPESGIDTTHMFGGNSFFGIASCKNATLWRIKLTYLRTQNEWSFLHYEAMGRHPNNHIIEYRGYGEIQQTTPLHSLTTNTTGNRNIDVFGTAYGFM